MVRPRARRALALQSDAPSETLTSTPRASAERAAAAAAVGTPTTGTSTRSSSPSAPAGTSPSTRIAAAPAAAAPRTLSGRPSARARSVAFPATTLNPRCVEVAAERSPRGPVPTSRRGRTTVSVSAVRGAAAPPSGTSRSSRTRRPARSTTRTFAVSWRRSAAATVSAAGAPPGPPMLPYPGPAGPSLPAGTTTSVSSRAAPKIARASGPSPKAAKGSVTPTTATRAASSELAVRVRVDRALQAGQQLVGAAVDREAARGGRLPAGDANRQD